MSTVQCQRCNKLVYHSCEPPFKPMDSTLALYTGDDDLGPLRRFFCCRSKKDVSDNFDVVQQNATYTRRHTIQFNLDSCNDGSRKNNCKQSILKSQKSAQEGKFGFIIPPSRSILKLLLAFPIADATLEALKRAAEKLALDVTHSTTYDSALEEFQTTHHDLIIIDSRSPKLLDYDTLCRSIRNTKGSQHIVVVSVVKKSSFEKDDFLIMSLLESGYNRCLVESSNLVTWMNELSQLKNSDCRSSAQVATTQILYAAINGCKDPVIITDDICRLQFLNEACEKLLGFRQDETLGKTLQHQLINEATHIGTMTTNLNKGRIWNGVIGFKRKFQDGINLMCKAVPIVCTGKSPTHFLIIIETHEGSINLQSRGSAHSLRKASIDIKNDYRRTSLAKLPLEAPITKVIHLLYDAMQNSTSQVCQHQLEKAIEMLKCTELYSPTVKEESLVNNDEPVANDLIGALLSNTNMVNHNVNSRRSSNDSSIFRVSKGVIRMKNQPPSNHIDRLLESFLAWNFEIFRLEELTDKRTLLYLGMKIFSHFDVGGTLNVEESVLSNWLMKIEANYHRSNYYHNSTHAADVMQAIAGFLEKDRMKDIMDPMDEATALIAAAAHDIDHPGKSSAFLANSDNPLAILYNDISVLESHHAALTFKLTLGDQKCNIFKNLDRDSYKIARYNVVDMILATEMTKHFEHLAKFVNVFCTKSSAEDLTDDVPTQAENITLVKRIMIKCADVSNPTRPLLICAEWARRIAEEYFQQTDEENQKGLPVVMPMFERTTCSIPKSQVGFIDFIINDMIGAWHAFIDMPEIVANMRINYLKWKELDERGIINSEDAIKAIRLQETDSKKK